MTGQSVKVVAKNRQATHEYFIEERIEAGLELFGTEVKSIRQGKVNLKDSWIAFQRGEAFIRGMHVSPYEKGNIFNRDPLRERKLLLHKREILKLSQLAQREGYSVIPLSLYLKSSRVKVEIALAKGKKLHDKRDAEAAKSAKREIDRTLKERNR